MQSGARAAGSVRTVSQRKMSRSRVQVMHQLYRSAHVLGVEDQLGSSICRARWRRGGGIGEVGWAWGRKAS